MPEVRGQRDHRVSSLLLSVPSEPDREFLHGRLDADHDGSPLRHPADDGLSSPHPLLFREQIELRRELRPHQAVGARAHAEVRFALEIALFHLVVQSKRRFKNGENPTKPLLLGRDRRFEGGGKPIRTRERWQGQGRAGHAGDKFTTAELGDHRRLFNLARTVVSMCCRRAIETAPGSEITCYF